jgi:hypothetical protein
LSTLELNKTLKKEIEDKINSEKKETKEEIKNEIKNDIFWLNFFVVLADILILAVISFLLCKYSSHSKSILIPQLIKKKLNN